MSVGPRVALLVALAVALLGGPATGGTVAGVGTDHQQVEFGEPTNLTMVVDVQPNGDARWTVTTRFDLSTAAEREAFGDLAASFRNGQTSALGLETFQRASARASERAGRAMAITGVEYRTASQSEIANGTGRLSVAFTWTNFGRTDGDKLYIDDAFETRSGTWLTGLQRGETLVIRAPDGYGYIDSTIGPQNRSLRWTGPVSFNASSFHATFTGQPGAGEPPGGTGGVPTTLLASAGLGVLFVSAYLILRYREGDGTPASSDDTPGDGTEAPARSQPDPAPEPEPEPEPESEPTDAVELLSDEERVERLLENNGGRMKQADIVTETGWSNAKVSQLLSAMEEDGRIDKLRIGRENLISFPDEEVTDIDT